MREFSINIKSVKPISLSHNEREIELDYNQDDLIKNNESWKKDSIENRRENILKSCKQISGRAMQKNATPIREAVVNLEEHHTMEDVRKMSKVLEFEFGVRTFQIHIHKDEGVWLDKDGIVCPMTKGEQPKFKHKNAVAFRINYHAHLLMDFQDLKTGKMKRLGKSGMSRMQTVGAKALKMKRGREGMIAQIKRYETVEFKRVKSEESFEKQEEKQKEKFEKQELKFNKLQEDVQILEQKKNRAAEANRAARKKYELHRASDSKEIRFLANNEITWQQLKGKTDAAGRAIEHQQKKADELIQEIERLESTIVGVEQDETFSKRKKWHSEIVSEIRKLEKRIHEVVSNP